MASLNSRQTLQEKLKSLQTGTKPVTSVSSAKKQLENYQKRLTASGLSATEATDTRNELEKFLNLPENQPFLLDALDLLSRPQQALFGGITANLKGQDARTGMMQGLKGVETTNFKDILKQDNWLGFRR